MCLVFLRMLETANCPGLFSETGEARAGKKRPRKELRFTARAEICKKRGKEILATLCVSSHGGQGFASLQFCFSSLQIET